jgi:hypothetical protein
LNIYQNNNFFLFFKEKNFKEVFKIFLKLKIKHDLKECGGSAGAHFKQSEHPPLQIALV